MGNQFDEDAARRARWAQRKIEMRRRKRRQELFRKALIPGGIVILIIIITIVIAIGRGKKETALNNVPDEVQSDVQGTAVRENEDSETDIKGTEAADQETVGEDAADKAATGKETTKEDTKKESAAQEGIGGRLEQIAKSVQENKENEDAENDPSETESQAYEFTVTEDTISLGENIVSSNAIFVDIASQTVLARKDETSRIVPASMTKVLTLLVAVENIDNLDDKFVMTREILDYCFINDCVPVGFEEGEAVTVKDLLYGAILTSGADAALGLAEYVAGSEEEFVALMNAKLEDMGLSGSAHFTNCVGVYDEGHYCSVYDMAVIMEAAVKNKTCREVLSAHTYTTSKTQQHPEGIPISNWFLRRIEDKDTGGEVICAKTGYVLQSGNCAVSYGMDKKGREYICVTVNAYNKWKCTEDHVYLYKRFSEKS